MSERAPEQPDEVTSFFDAIARGDRDAVRLQAGVDPSLVHALDQRRFGATVVTAAVLDADVAMLDLLISLGAGVNAKSDWWAGGFGALHLTRDPLTGARSGEGMHAALIERGAVVDAHAAARLGMVDRLRELLDADAELVGARGGDGQMPLHFALDVETANLLLERGAEIDARDIDHVSTAAQWAIGDRAEVTRFLISQGAESDEFMLAAIGETESLRKMIEADSALLEGRVTRARFASPGSEGGHMYTYVIGEDCTLLQAATRYGRVETMRMLLEMGADVNGRGGYDQCTPLHVAAWHDQAEAARALVEAGADVDARSGPKEHDTALNWTLIKAATGTARALIEAGAAVGDEQREYVRRGLAGEFKGFTGVDPRRYAEVEALVGG